MATLHAVITGAAGGIGASIARALAAEGACLTLMGRREAPLRAMAEELQALPGGDAARAHGITLVDVSDESSVQRAFSEARTARGPIDILVNNAGQADSAPFTKTDLALWQRMLAVNLTGTFLCTQAALPDMLAAKAGRIVNVASTAGLKGYAYVAAYTAAKHGVVGLTRSLALELAKKGITVNAVCPGYTDTELLRASMALVMAKTGRSEEQTRAEFAQSNPQGRLVTPEEVADAVRWLCSAGAGSINGQAISISGGEVM